MKKDIKHYKQSGNACAIACLLMILEYYDVIAKANYVYEKKYYNSYSSQYLLGVPLSAVFWHLIKNNINAEMFHSEKNLFSNNKQMIDDNIFNLAIIEYKEYLEYAILKGAKVYNGVNINIDLIKEKVKDNFIILAGVINQNFHTILITSFKNDYFIVNDPAVNVSTNIKCDKVNEFMNTDIGKWFIAIPKGEVYEEEI